MLLTASIEQSITLIDILVKLYEDGFINHKFKNLLYNFKVLEPDQSMSQTFHEMLADENLIENALEYCIASLDNNVAFEYILKASQHHTFALYIKSEFVLQLLTTIDHEISK